MDNTRTAQLDNPSSSSNETITEDRQTTTDASSTDAASSYCPDCPICNPPDTKSASVSTYGTIEPLSHNFQPFKPTFLETSLEICAEIYCCICDSPPPSIRSSEWSSTPYPSSLSSNSYSYTETETGLSQDQASDAGTVNMQNLSRQDDGYKKQQEMRSIKDGGLIPYPQRSE
ncbi:hypothetical protein TrVFT333_011603 [Trichoderma virens FT-333]|nr:hypothetical protein TrVFT333_011603 [Trichoderma virens FT-333]